MARWCGLIAAGPFPQVISAMHAVEPELHKELVRNTVLCGGLACMQGLPERFEAEIRALVQPPTRAHAPCHLPAPPRALTLAGRLPRFGTCAHPHSRASTRALMSGGEQDGGPDDCKPGAPPRRVHRQCERAAPRRVARRLHLRLHGEPLRAMDVQGGVRGARRAAHRPEGHEPLLVTAIFGGGDFGVVCGRRDGVQCVRGRGRAGDWLCRERGAVREARERRGARCERPRERAEEEGERERSA